MSASYLKMFGSYSAFMKQMGAKKYQLKPSEFDQLEKNVVTFLTNEESFDTLNYDEAIDSINVSDTIIDCLIGFEKNCKSPEQKRKLANLIRAMKGSMLSKLNNLHNKKETDEADEEKEESRNETESSPDEKTEVKAVTQPESKVKQKEVERKYQTYSLYAANNILDKAQSNFVTKKQIISTKQFDNLTREQLVEMFSAEKFYDLSESEVHSLMQAVVNDYLKEKGIKSCAVELDDLPFDKNCITHGEYNPNDGSIKMNKNVLALKDAAGMNQDEYYPLQLLATLIHEADHRYQFSNTDKSNLSTRDRLAVEALRNPENQEYGAYLSSADELDARNAAQEYIRECSRTAQNGEALSQFYNIRKQMEMSQPKDPVSAEVEAEFSDIYDQKMLETHQQQFVYRTDYVQLQKDMQSIRESGR